MPDSPSESRRRWINIGEIVAVAGLIISGLALWNSWGGGKEKIVVGTPPRTIALALRGTIQDEGKAISLAPAEPSHTLESLTFTALSPGKGSAPFGSDPLLSAATIETWLPKDSDNEAPGAVTLATEVRYIENGQTKVSRQRYRVAYRWTEGGLFGGNSLRLTGITRA